jgi:hypothetical protein
MRVEERFPDRGITSVSRDLDAIAKEARKRASWISTPHTGLRVAIAFAIGILIVSILTVLFGVELEMRTFELGDLLQTLEAGINDLILIGAAIYFLTTVEGRIKRHRAMNALHELRSLAHVIDMHQLTKDPERVLNRGVSTASSPVEKMTTFELSRYLDYCSEMLSVIGKIAALYVQEFNDPVALSAVNEIETLTTGLSRKIWQKIMILHSFENPGNSLSYLSGERTTPATGTGV